MHLNNIEIARDLFAWKARFDATSAQKNNFQFNRRINSEFKAYRDLVFSESN